MQKIMASKPCSRCGEVRPLDQYYTDKRHRDGKKSNCKACHNAYSMRWQSANREKCREFARKTYHNNRDKRLPQMRAWKAANPDKLEEYARDRQAEASSRCQRIHRIIDHFKGREGWLEKLAFVLGRRSDIASISYVSAKIDDLVRVYYYKEEL